MDILAHGLWAGAAAKAINLKRKRPLKTWRVVFWSVLPDFFAFTPVFAWLLWQLLFGQLDFGQWPTPDQTEPAPFDTLPIFQLTHSLYNISHSLAVFLIVAGLVSFGWRRLPWEMGGWLLHILIDIPSHSYRFYPTPFLWPFSDWKFDGWSWSQSWFMLINYALLITVYWWFWRRKKKEKAIDNKSFGV